jgi:predicted PurR-regulated permease PerM
LDKDPSALRDNILILAGLVLLLAGLKLSAGIIVPFLLSLFITMLATTPLEWLRRRGLPDALAVLLVLLAVIMVVTLVGILVGSTATQFNEALPGYQSRLNELMGDTATWFSQRGIDISDTGLFSALDPSVVMGFANTLVMSIGDVFSNAVLIMFTVMFMLFEVSGFQRKLASMDGQAGATALERLTEVVESVNRYATAKALVSLATGLLVWIALELVGLDFAPLWGFIAFLLNFVPNIGSILAAVPAVILAILQLDPTMVLVVIAIYVVINTVIGNVIEPMVMGQSVGLSPLAVFLSLVFWGWMFGAVGMLLSVPLSMVVKFAAQSSPKTQWLAILLGPSPSVAPSDEVVAE